MNALLAWVFALSIALLIYVWLGLLGWLPK